MDIHDTRSGHLVAKHAVELDHKDFQSSTRREVSELGWSRCGRRIYVRIRLYFQDKVRERVVFVIIGDLALDRCHEALTVSQHRGF